jgi:DNA-binding beta-propeller fold protein YncE
MNARTRRLILTMLSAALGVLAFSVAPAFAGVTYPFDGEFAPSSGSFGSLEANSVAVDDSNDQTYVADEGTGLVTVFNAAHMEVGVLDGGATPAGSFGFGNGEGAVAVNNNTGDIYVLDSTHAVVDVFDAAGAYKCQITGSSKPPATECDGVVGSETPSKGFLTPRGLAVNQDTGEIYVLDAEHGVIDRFTITGKFASQVEFSKAPIELSGGETRGLAVNSTNGEIYVGEGHTSSVAIFDSSGTFVETWTGSNTPAESFAPAGSGSEINVAVDDASGRVYVTASAQKITDVFEASGSYVTQFSHEYVAVRGTAVDQATGEVLVSNNRAVPAPSAVDVFGPAATIPDVITEGAEAVTAVSATLHGTVNPDSIALTECSFEYGTTTAYGSEAPCVPAAGEISSEETPVEAAVAGLKPATTYHFRLAASNASGSNTGADVTFVTLPRPVIEHAVAEDLTESTATLVALVNPEGSGATYKVEWGTSPAYEHQGPVHGLPSGTTAVDVSEELTGLTPGVHYHWRIEATNENGTTVGEDHSFSYQATPSLPDGRRYEMVTPVQKNAALIGAGLFLISPDLADNGNRVYMTSIQCLPGTPSCTGTRETEGEPYAFTRTATGWVTTPLAPPALPADATSSWFMNATTGTALFSIPSAPGTQDDFYRRTESGEFQDLGPATEPADGSLGTLWAGLHLDATPDMSDVAFELTQERWAFDPSVGVAQSSYELSGVGNSAPHLVGVSGGAGSTALLGECGERLGETGSLSEDGRVLYITINGHDLETVACPTERQAPPVSELYARVDHDESVLISGRSMTECITISCTTSHPGDARFEGASNDGSKAYFTDTQQLTDQATQDANAGASATLGDGCAEPKGSGCNLYEYDFDAPGGHQLRAISVGAGSEGPKVQHIVAISRDGSHAYFTARGRLTSTANSEGAKPVAGAENLYCYEREAAHPEGRVVFVATLSAKDSSETSRGSHEGGNAPANVTPDGRYLVFTSHAPLTDDDDSTTEAAQVYEFDAQEEKLTRVSIGQAGYDDNGNTFDPEECELTCPLDARLASTLSDTYRQDASMSDDGSYIFFMSPLALTPGALNRYVIFEEKNSSGKHVPAYEENVYEFHNGVVSLVSDGKDTSAVSDEPRAKGGVELLGSDATGANVFFATADQLVPQDTDTQQDYYDARIGGGFPAADKSHECDSASECRGLSGVAGESVVPGSVNYVGPGNVTPAAPVQQATKPAKPPTRAQKLKKAIQKCHKMKKKAKRSTCERQARRKFGPIKRKKKNG